MPAPQKMVKVLTPKADEVANKDKSLEWMVRYLAEADGIHREAWWVLTAARPPIGKSPFGKAQRALLASQNIKLTNKSLFRCDRYLVKRDVLGLVGYPQKGEIFEKCSEKTEAKRLASFDVPKEGELNIVFYPDNLQEVLGLGAGILNKQIQCSLRGKEKLESLNCKDWAQDRSKEQMIRLDVYDYQKSGKNLIKLRGKVYENLTDIRKIEADVPMEGKITVLETELYAPEAPPVVVTPTPSVAPVKPGIASPTMPTMPPPRDLPDGVDPDVMMQRGQQQGQGVESVPVEPGADGWPEGEAPPQDEGMPQEHQEGEMDPSMIVPEPIPQPIPQQIEPVEGAPHGR
ncbi:hypothetical protein EZJ49_13395 [Bdellovibrio bacteriovorus]|uniref:hypothetical protein n=1 Tax=Bdellovibrio bacteriovorus TaxID=959 RepID=UPI0021D01793|nr:hypothetical protein [Bdellovibrio bacteriovorus]UXR64059.1 hypothetical protein EZJ49_13395 [Bdellovibrio bacteriovorus]